MTIPSKLLWGEGLFLHPQHFQQQDRYHEARLNQTARTLHPYAWGVRRLALDGEALASDVLRIASLSLVFPDGELYRAPEGDLLPPEVRLDALPPSTQAVTFHAALPTLKAHGGNCAADASCPDARFVQVEQGTRDLFSHATDAPLSYLRKSLRLVPEDGALDACDSLPLLRLRRGAGGSFELDPEFVAPSVSIDAAPALPQLLARLLEKLLAKVNALYGQLREPRRKAVEIRSGDMSSFWMLHTASSGYAALSHYLYHPELHPERLFADLLALAGGLMAYSRDYRLEDLPAYSHADPGPVFARLADILGGLLDTVVPERHLSIALSRERPSHYLGTLDPDRVTPRTALYLAVGAEMAASQLIETVPLRFKLGAPQDVDAFVLSALPGVALRHAPEAPAALPLRPDFQYFALDNRDPLYASMLKAQAIAVYVPDGMPDLRLELLGVAS